MTQENFKNRDVTIQERCRTIRAVCWTTVAVGIASTTILNTALAIKGFNDAMKASRHSAQYVGTYTVNDSENI